MQRISSFEEYLEVYKTARVGTTTIYDFQSEYTHLVIILDLTASLWYFEDGDFEFRLLIASLDRLFKNLNNQLVSIFINDAVDDFVTFLRNHALDESNKQLVADSIIQYVKQKYRNSKDTSVIDIHKKNKKSIQAFLFKMMASSRCPDIRYEHKKILLFTDFLNFDFEEFSHILHKEGDNYFMWDSRGFIYSLNVVYLGSQDPGVSRIVDLAFIQNYLYYYNGYLYSHHKVINVNQTQFKYASIQPNAVPIVDLTDLLQGAIPDKCYYAKITTYPIHHQQDFAIMRLKEGYQLQSSINNSTFTLKMKLNSNMSLYYLVYDDQITVLAQNEQINNLKNSVRSQEGAPTYIDYLRQIGEQLKHKDSLQLQMYSMNFQDLVQLKAFESWHFIDRNFKQRSLYFVLKYASKSLDLLKGQSIYEYISDKIKEIANKSIGNYLLYVDPKGDSVMVRIEWHSHTILRLICMYSRNDNFSQRIDERIKDVIKRDVILNSQLIYFDYSLNYILVSDNYTLMINREHYKIQKKWEWDHVYIWKIEEMYKILCCMRVKLGYTLIPCLNNQFDRVYIQQVNYESKPIIFISKLQYDQENRKIRVQGFTQQILTVNSQKEPIKNIILTYFQQMMDQEYSIIRKLYTIHYVYRSSLKKKLNDTISLDFFVMNYLDIQSNKRKDRTEHIQLLNSFKDRALGEIKLYPEVRDEKLLDFDSLFKHAYLYAEQGLEHIEDVSLTEQYLSVLQSHSNYTAVLKENQKIKITKFEGYINFIVIGCRKLLMITLDEIQIRYYLLGLDDIERNIKVPLFLNQQQQGVLNNLIKYIDNQNRIHHSQMVHQLCGKEKYPVNIDTCLKACQVFQQEIDLTEVYVQLKTFFSQTANLKIPQDAVTPLLSSGGSIQKKNRASQSFMKSKYKLDSIWHDLCSKYDLSLIHQLKTLMQKIPKHEVYYWTKNEIEKSRKEQDCIILFVRVSSKDSEGEQPFHSYLKSLVINEDNNKRHQIIMSYYYVHQKSQKQLRDEPISPSSADISHSAGLLPANSQTPDLKYNLKLIRWSDYMKNYFQLVNNNLLLDLKRFDTLSQETFKNIVSLICSSNEKNTRLLASEKGIGLPNFSVFFKAELVKTQVENQLCQFEIIEDYYVFVMNSKNCNIDVFDLFQNEKDYFIQDKLYVVPFWLILRQSESNIECLYCVNASEKSSTIEAIVNEVQSSIAELVKTAIMQLMIKSATQALDSKQLILKQPFVIDQTTEAPQINVRRNNTKRPTITRGTFEVEIPMVGWRIIEIFQGFKGRSLKSDILPRFIRNTVLNNYKCYTKEFTYFGFSQGDTYLISFQIVTQVQAFIQKYPDIKVNESDGFLLLYFYSANRDKIQIEETIEYFYRYIQTQQEQEILQIINQSLNRAKKIQNIEYEYLNSSENINSLKISINPQIRDLHAYSLVMKQNMERVFHKYEIKDNLGTSNIEIQTDQIYIQYGKLINPVYKLDQIFGDSVSIISVAIQSDTSRISQFIINKGTINQPVDIDIQLEQQEITDTQRSPQQEFIYDASNLELDQNYSVGIQIKTQGTINLQSLKQYLGILMQSVDSEYFIECLLQQNESVIRIQRIFDHLKNYSFNLQKFHYVLKYDSSDWLQVMNFVRSKIRIEFRKKQIETINEQMIAFENGQNIALDSLTQKSHLYFIISDQGNALDAVKQIKKLTSEISRSILLIMCINDNGIYLYSYNYNWDQLYPFHQFLKHLSKWSITRQIIEQYIKGEEIDTIQNIYRKKEQLYENSPLNEIARLHIYPRDQDARAPKEHHTKFLNLTRAIEYIIKNVITENLYHFTEIQEYLNQFTKIPVKGFKYQEGPNFLQREGLNYLEAIKNEFQVNFSNWLIEQYNKNQIDQRQFKKILDKLVTHHSNLNTKMEPFLLEILQKQNKKLAALESWIKIKNSSNLVNEDLEKLTNSCIIIPIEESLIDSNSKAFAIKTSKDMRTILIPDETETIFCVIKLDDEHQLKSIRMYATSEESEYLGVRVHYSSCLAKVKELNFSQ